jgi:hypothetical protein
MEEKQVDCVVFAVADNNIYLAMYNGETSPALKDSEGNFHVCGDLVLSSKSAQHSLFNLLKPVFDKVRSKHVLFMTPLPRYIVSGCCSDAEHMANRSQPGFELRLLKDLTDTAENFKNFMFTSGYKRHRQRTSGSEGCRAGEENQVQSRFKGGSRRRQRWRRRP